MRSDYLNSNSSVGNFDLKIKKVTADITLTDADSGSIIMVNPTATTEVDLPALSSISSGWNLFSKKIK